MIFGERLAGEIVSRLESRLAKIPRRQCAEAVENGEIRDGADAAVLVRERPETFPAQASAIASTPAASATETPESPRIAIAFRFFAPMTAPTPPRPACLPSLLIVAKRTRFSPAKPIAATRASDAFTAVRTKASVDAALRPRQAAASPKTTRPRSTKTYDSDSARPVTTSASMPARLSSSAK